MNVVFFCRIMSRRIMYRILSRMSFFNSSCELQRHRGVFDNIFLSYLPCKEDTEDDALGLQIPSKKVVWGVFGRLSTFSEGIWSPRDVAFVVISTRRL